MLPGALRKEPSHHSALPGGRTAHQAGHPVPLRAGSFCSSRFLLRLKREELCRRSFFTIWGPPEYLILFSWVGGGALLLGRLFEVGCCCCGCCCGCWA